MVLGVAPGEADVAEGEVAPALLGAGEERLGEVEAEDVPGGADGGGERQGGAAGAAADVEHALARAGGAGGEEPVGDLG